MPCIFSRSPPNSNRLKTATGPSVLCCWIKPERIELAYYGREEIEAESTWRAEWQHAELLPDLISLRVYPAAGGRAWPQMIIPVYADPVKGQPHNVLRGADPAE